jgi:hypothetical protein
MQYKPPLHLVPEMATWSQAIHQLLADVLSASEMCVDGARHQVVLVRHVYQVVLFQYALDPFQEPHVRLIIIRCKPAHTSMRITDWDLDFDSRDLAREC